MRVHRAGPAAPHTGCPRPTCDAPILLRRGAVSATSGHTVLPCYAAALRISAVAHLRHEHDPRYEGWRVAAASGGSLFFASVTVTCESSRAASISSGDTPGFALRSAAAQAAATGDACDVPEYVDVPPPRPVDVIGDPGASKFVAALLFVNDVG